MTQAKRITINDVAQAAGVSVATVSLVLSGKGRISSATGQRVNDAIEQLGFVRNRQASALRGGPSGVIGLIVRDLTTPFYAELTAGLSEALEAQGRMLFLLQGGRDEARMQRCFDTLLDQGVDGVVVAGGTGQVGAWQTQARARNKRHAVFKIALIAPVTALSSGAHQAEPRAHRHGAVMAQHGSDSRVNAQQFGNGFRRLFLACGTFDNPFTVKWQAVLQQRGAVAAKPFGAGERRTRAAQPRDALMAAMNKMFGHQSRRLLVIRAHRVHFIMMAGARGKKQRDVARAGLRLPRADLARAASHHNPVHDITQA